MGSERRQSLIDVELARTEFRLDVIKLREQLGAFVPGLRPKGPKSPPVAGVGQSPSTASIRPDLIAAKKDS
jgi:hypothetical protein